MRAALFMSSYAVSTGAVLFGVLRYRPPSPAAWRVIAATLLTWLVAWGFWQQHVARTGHAPATNSLALNLPFLPAYALLALALSIHLVRRERSLLGLLDAATIGTSIAMLAWVALLHRYLDADTTTITRDFQLFYGFADVILLSLAARLLWSRQPGRDAPTIGMMAATTSIVGSDLLWNWSTATGLYEPGRWADIGWFLGPSILGFVALQPAMVVFGERAQRTDPWAPTRATWLLLGASLIPGVVLLVMNVADRTDELGAVAIGASAVGAFVVARLAMVIQGQQALAQTIVAQNRQLTEGEAHLRSIFEHSPLGMSICDLDGRIISVNRRRLEMLGAADEHPVVGRRLADVVGGRDQEQLERLLARLRVGEVGVGRVEMGTERPDGSPLWAAVTASVIRGGDDEPRFIVTMAEDITARRRLDAEREQMLHSQRERTSRLLELDRLKDEFVATVSHELRTPLTSILGYLDLALDTDSEPLSPQQRSFLEAVERNAARLHRLVGDLLLTAQVEAGTLALSPTRLDLREVAGEVVELARPVAESGGVTLRLGPGTAVAEADRARVVQVVENLVSNACRFTPAGGTVSVRVRTAGARVAVEVEDTGVGIEEGDLARVFDRFYQGEGARRGAAQGSGLGLSIAKSIADAHGGDIEVRSEPGAGSTFTFWLPAEQT